MTDVEETESSPLVLRMTRSFDAPMERVFRAFADPEQLVKWWGPTGMSVIDHDINVRVGGAWRTTIQAKGGDEYTMSGVYREISPPHRLAFTWAWERDGERGHETMVTIQLSEDGERTKLAFLQEIFDTEEMRDSHQDGWHESFICLTEALENEAIQ